MKSNNTHPLNKHNSHFYSTYPHAFTEFGLANFFVVVEPVQTALKSEIESRVKNREIDLLEIGSGATTDRWQTISDLPTDHDWKITLSDFDSNALPPNEQLPQTPDYCFKTKVLNLLQPLKKQNKKHDVLLATYTFDSIWFPEDLRLIKNENNFFLARTHPAYDTITGYLAGTPQAKINYPGGLINFVTAAYLTILKAKGTIIIGDIAVAGPAITPSHEKSGRQALFKREDYRLAQLVLTSLGFTVQLISLSDFMDKWHVFLPLDLSDHFLLIINK